MKHDSTEPEPERRPLLRRLLGKYLPLIAAQRSDLSQLLQYFERRGLIDADEQRIINSTLRASGLRVRDVMIASAQMVAIDARLSPDKIIEVVVQSTHSRFPVLDLGNNEVLGLLLAKDLLAYLARGEQREDFDIKPLLRELTIVPESKRLDAMLEDFRRKRIHMAAVVDEHNDVAGIITIEDVLEEIVGEIDDEHDKKATSSQYLSSLPGMQNTYLVQGQMPLELFNEHFDSDFDADEHDTISGVILDAMQHLPSEGEQIALGQWLFTVTAASERRILELQISPVG